MARRSKNDPLYEAFRQFKARCLLDDRSMLWPEQNIWTAENISAVKKRLADDPFGSEFSFKEKLLRQMEGASPEQWQIIADIYYLYSLPSLTMKFKTKIEKMRWAANRAGISLPPQEAEVFDPLNYGFVGTGYRYHLKFAQFWLILLFATELKSHPHPKEILNNPDQMQHMLDQLLQSIEEKTYRAYGMRHALLYLAFPQHYEDIISTRAKERIVATFKDRLVEPTPEDTDQALREIRTKLRERRDTDEYFSFYDPELKQQWSASSKPKSSSQRERPTAREDTRAQEAYLARDEEVAAIISALDHTRNVILYGPPGTGKTYLAKKAAEALVKEQLKAPLSESALIQRALEGLTVYEILALSMYRENPEQTYSVSDLLEQPLIKARHRISPVQHPRQSIWSSLQYHTSPESEEVDQVQRWEPYLFDKDTESRWYLTTQGRAYVKETLAEPLTRLQADEVREHTGDFVMWSTFHQSYAYEDFVEGLRPVLASDNPEGIAYDIVDGTFKRIARRAAEDPEHQYVLVIDEINRGNIAKILGELITLLEDDKRAGQPNALTVTLPYSSETFSVPKNLLIIGTMNTADRSIALLDVALRRRFAFIELMPQPELLSGVNVESEETIVPLDRLLIAINKGIRKYLDRDHQIGHSYFLDVADVGPEEQAIRLEFVWNHRILPLLEEYFYSQREYLAELLAPLQTDLDSEIRDGDEGFEFARLTGDDLLTGLVRIAERT